MSDIDTSTPSQEATSQAPSSDPAQSDNSSQAQSSEQSSQQEGQQQQQTETTSEGKPEGWQQVDFSPEQQARFNRVFRELKDYQRETFELRDIAKQQFDVIEQLKQGQNQIVSHIQNNDFDKAENILKNQRREAYEKGDLAAVDEVNDRLSEIKIQRKLSDLTEKAKQQNALKQQQTQQIQQRPVSGDDIVTHAVRTGAITLSDAAVYKAWAGETDQYGNLLRPWINERDTRNLAAASEGRAVFSNPSLANKSFAEKLQEIDRRMGVANKRQSDGGVMSGGVMPGGNLTRGAKMNTVKLTPYQEQVAVKTRFAGPNKSSQEHIEAYRAQVAAIKGGRK